MKFLQRNRPDLPPDLIESVLATRYGLDGELTLLESERDQNLEVETPESSYLFKVCNPDETDDVIDLQVKALRHIEKVDPSLPVPRALPTNDGQDVDRLTHDGVSYPYRLMTFLEGDIAGRAEYDTPEFRHNTGSILAALDRALSSFFHPAAHQDHPWNVMGVPRLLEYVDHISDEAARRNITAILERVRDVTIPACRALRHQVIHQDAHTSNLVVDPDNPSAISGIIDFGDMAHAPLVIDLAVAAHLSGRPDGSPETVIDLVLGYDSVTRLEEDEIDVLFDLILSRLAMSATIAAARVSLFPGEDPYEDDQERLWKRIEIALAAQGDVSTELRSVLGFRRTHAPGLPQRRNSLLTPHSPHFYEEPLEVVAGEGMFLIGADGTRYLDFYNNVPIVGHNHPQVVNAVSRQLATLNTNTRYLYEPVVEFAERLVATLGHDLDVCLFVNSGSEANDVASQIVKHRAGHDRLAVLARAYHGVTEASNAITSPPASNVVAIDVETGDVPQDIGGLFVDPALTSSGMPRVPENALRDIAEAVQRGGGLVAADEVQSGFGRTGVMWGHERENLVPDLVTLGKPVGNGFPLGVVVSRRDILEPFMAETGLFSTFGGNPVACAAGLAVLDVVARENLVANSAETGEYLRDRLRSLEHPSIHDVRGTGLLVGVELTETPAAVRDLLEELRLQGVLVGTAGGRRQVLKLRPPLIADRSHVDSFVTAFAESLPT